jgi:16S rRNA (uracil1498-N3)-methyltransferase
MQLFYSENITGNIIILNEEESKHCGRVLRKKLHDEIEVIDGKGNYFKAVIIDENFKEVIAEIKETVSNWKVNNYSITIAMALSKNPERFEWFCEKAAEIGVNEIIPIVTTRTEKKQFKPERIQKILLSAIKQSGKALLPTIQPEISFKDFLKNNAKYSSYQKYIGWCETGLDIHLKNKYTKGYNAIILIGPEGDFTKEEVDVAITENYLPVSLGNSRLRMETAGIVACHIVNLLNE